MFGPGSPYSCFPCFSPCSCSAPLLTHHALTLVAGAGFGAALGLYGLRLTKFEQTAQGLFYTPSAHLGIALSLLFVGRANRPINPLGAAVLVVLAHGERRGKVIRRNSVLSDS